MESRLEGELELLCEYLFERNNILLYGTQERTHTLLREVYDLTKNKKEFLCSWHDASAITQPMDFFEPILRLKYGNRYALLKEKSWFKDLTASNDKEGVFQLASLCGREKNSENEQERRWPVIFIDGVEELFFIMDYGHLDEDGRRRLLTGNFMTQPLPRGFGDCLRGHLHQTGNGIFVGTIRDINNIQFAATLGNYHYLFYKENFIEHRIEED